MHRIKNETISQYDAAVSKVLSAYWVVDATNVFIKTSFTNGFLQSYINLILAAVFFVVFCRQIKYVRSEMSTLIIMELLFVVLTAFGLLINEGQFDAVKERMLWTFMFCIPLFVLGRNIDNISDVLNETIPATFLVMVMTVVMVVTGLSAKSDGATDYSIKVGYMLLFPCLMHMYKIKEKAWYWVPVVFELMAIVIAGSRGPLLCVGVYILLDVLFGTTTSKRAKWLKVIVLLLGIFVVWKLNAILVRFSSLLNVFSIDSRTVRMFLSGDIVSDSGRSLILEETIACIKKKPIFGWGVAGDLYCMSGYPHQLFFELILDFGLIGAVISLVMCWDIVKNFIRTNYKSMIIILFCSQMVPLFMSSTYLQFPVFWFLVGISNPLFGFRFKSGGNQKQIG